MSWLRGKQTLRGPPPLRSCLLPLWCSSCFQTSRSSVSPAGTYRNTHIYVSAPLLTVVCVCVFVSVGVCACVFDSTCCGMLLCLMSSRFSRWEWNKGQWTIEIPSFFSTMNPTVQSSGRRIFADVRSNWEPLNADPHAKHIKKISSDLNTSQYCTDVFKEFSTASLKCVCGNRSLSRNHHYRSPVTPSSSTRGKMRCSQVR